jgi:spore germination protein KC
MAQDKIKQKIIDCFNTCKELKTDTLGIGTSIYRKYPKEWKEMKGQWNDMLQDIDFDVQVKIHIPETGQTLQSLEMGEK